MCVCVVSFFYYVFFLLIWCNFLNTLQKTLPVGCGVSMSPRFFNGSNKTTTKSQ